METETRLFARIDLLRIRRLVKLNNPLMGTETLVETHFGGREDLKLN